MRCGMLTKPGSLMRTSTLHTLERDPRLPHYPHQHPCHHGCHILRTSLMHRAGIVLFAMWLGLLSCAGARAGVLTSPGEDLEVSLVTYGPGAVYWERFGHDAIRIRDRVSGESGDFNYGVFDFEDSAFMLNFARGRMRYMIDAETSDINQQDFVAEGRSVLEQRLALSPA